MYVEELLSGTVHNLIIANTGLAGLQLSKSEKPDLILMDIRLPDINGLDLVRVIRKFNTDVYILAQTAYAMKSDREKAINAGCNDYISKPIPVSLLLEKIDGIYSEIKLP